MFQVYSTLDQRTGPREVAAHARRAEALGYDGLCVPEAVHDGLLMASIALGVTTRLRVATSVLVAFPRSPMTLAHAAWDLQLMSAGRFELGLGSQVRGNIVGRYSTAWTPPVPRMREYVCALRAIFDCFANGTPLRFEGEHYRFTRLQPFFNPGPIEAPEIPIWLGAVGPGMTALAGEQAQGLMTHPSNCAPRYLREVTQPRLAAGAARAQRSLADVEILLSPLIATGPDRESALQAREKRRELLGFLYSTPAYWPTLLLFGWQERGERLRQLTREGRWGEMAAQISDRMLEELVPCASYAEIGDLLRRWYGGLATRIIFPMPEVPDQDGPAAKVIAGLRLG